jgi:AraC family transcriptional regulator
MPRIEQLQEKKLVGFSVKMNLIENKTAQLWKQFGPRIKEIKNKVNEDKISMQIYDPFYFKNFKPEKEFEKWATVEVKDQDAIPDGMKAFKLREGLYAVFDYQGLSSDSFVYQYIFFDWLPNSPYRVDNRPHFEVLGKDYRNNDPKSKEEIWIPIIDKSELSN